jgi:hypothetical protein
MLSPTPYTLPHPVLPLSHCAPEVPTIFLNFVQMDLRRVCCWLLPLCAMLVTVLCGGVYGWTLFLLTTMSEFALTHSSCPLLLGIAAASCLGLV